MNAKNRLTNKPQNKKTYDNTIEELRPRYHCIDSLDNPLSRSEHVFEVYV